LVNEAYQELAELGLNFTGTYQDDAMTLHRMQGKEVILAIMENELVGTISLERRQTSGGDQLLYISQLAVAPRYKRSGVGRFLLNHAEVRAQEQGITRLQLDTAAPAQHLVRLYASLGYHVIDEVQWDQKTYRSYIMEKRIALVLPASSC
jgi:ribosomal protein S18 acetylase RimI-like enzyme